MGSSGGESPGVSVAALSPFQVPSKRSLPQRGPKGWTVVGTPTGIKDLLPQLLIVSCSHPTTRTPYSQ